MDKHHIRILITRFFENDFPKESVLKFQQWFAREEDSVVKNEVLNELWEQEEAQADKHTLQALEEMNRRIGKNKKNSLFVIIPKLASYRFYFTFACYKRSVDLLDYA